MDSSANSSSASTSWMPVFDVRYHSHQDGQNWFSGWSNDEANALTNTQHAAGSVGACPLPSPRPPTSAIYSFDQWAALLSVGHHSNIHASHYLDLPNSGSSCDYGFQDSGLSSCYSYVTVTSLISPSVRSLTAQPQHAPIIYFIPTRRRCIVVSYFPRPVLPRFVQPLLSGRCGRPGSGHPCATPSTFYWPLVQADG
jgi:hypothetical protein